MNRFFKRNATATLATTLITLASFSLPAAAADQSHDAYDTASPISSSQSSLLRNAPNQNAQVAAAEPISEDVPATRSQIEVLDRQHAHFAASVR